MSKDNPRHVEVFLPDSLVQQSESEHPLMDILILKLPIYTFPSYGKEVHPPFEYSFFPTRIDLAFPILDLNH